MVKVKDLSKEIARQLSLYTESVKEEVEVIKEDVTKEAVSLLKQKSPKDTGSYAKSWARKKVGKNIVIYNKAPNYRLTHLLENGHVKRGGGRVAAKVHIRPVEEKIVDEYVSRVERAIKQ
ncbi:HK97 gp10 family phage protein [Heyndrickxia oleronia]|uniref:HK97 gp10 family phage protein n=1 Tax=Heyndrickxia oleronia TaxID=38875 RepID=UPI00203B0086|nr:HK97 gp10 family phage protein [Heyndrickxia oleronia]MCM3454404.1 HK97 gp10 family phage protein [Heyndrickxia oleronia]